LELDPEIELSFIGQKGDSNLDLIRKYPKIKDIYTVRAGKFRRFHSLSLWQNITNFKVNLLNARDFLLVILGFFQAISALMRIKPDVIFFKGGFVVVPIGYAARLLRIPYMTHDSDPLPGLANRLIATGARKNAVVSEDVTTYPKSKMVVTGVPLSKEYRQRRGALQAEFKQQLGFPQNSTLVFVYTGTQGAKKVDDALEPLLPRILDDYSDVEIAYVFGRLNEKSKESRFVGLSQLQKSRIRTLTFIDNAYDYIAASDIIVCRAGATSMAEFSTIGRATIIIPAEQLTGGHQLMNAEMYAKDNAALIVKEAEMPVGLDKALRTLLDSPEYRKSMEAKLRLVAPENAAKSIAGHLIQIVTRSSR